MEERFLLPGSDGELDPAANIWRKGVVFTLRSAVAGVKPGYRVSAAFKRSLSEAHPLVDFHGLYERVASVANRRISELTLPDPSLTAAIVCHGWRLLTDSGNMAAAFITIAIRSRHERETDLSGEQPPTHEDLLAPGGASLEDLDRLKPQQAEEIYNEFDFTNPLVPSSDPITVSYGEAIPESDPIDFAPFVERAETFAKAYHDLLRRLGEVNSPFRAAHRQWFLADRKFVTIHICFCR